MQGRREDTATPEFCVRNPNKAWVSEEIDKLIAEWTEWNEFCSKLAEGEDSPDFNPSTCSEAIKDGFANRRKHEVLREKTLVFIRNQFTGGEFILTGWTRPPYENVIARLNKLAPTWLHRLEILKASMDYVLVPEGYWQGQGKRFLENLSKSTADGALEVAASFLKNPMRD